MERRLEDRVTLCARKREREGAQSVEEIWNPSGDVMGWRRRKGSFPFSLLFFHHKKRPMLQRLHFSDVLTYIHASIRDAASSITRE